MVLWKKKKKEALKEESLQKESKEQKITKEKNSSTSSKATDTSSLLTLKVDVDRLKNQFEIFMELRKTFNDRLAKLSEQMGEIRGMVLDRDRLIQQIEVKAIKAADMVESVRPDKFMIELQKQDAKTEAVKANIEANEAIMSRIMEELKEVRTKLKFFHGLDEIIKLNEDVKKELIEVQKVEGNVKLKADRVDLMFSEIKKKFQDIEMFKSGLDELKFLTNENKKDVESLKEYSLQTVKKDDMEKLIRVVEANLETLKGIKKSTLSEDVKKIQSMLNMIK